MDHAAARWRPLKLTAILLASSLVACGGDSHSSNPAPGESPGPDAGAEFPDAGADAGVLELVLESFAVEAGADSTGRRVVELSVAYGGGPPTEYQASESPDFEGASWRPFSTPILYQLSTGDGSKTLYLRLRTAERTSNVLSDDIELAEAATTLIRQSISPSNEPVSVRWSDWVSVTVPGGLVQAPTELAVAALPAAPAHPCAGRVSVGAYDITLGDLHGLSAPLEVQLGYEPWALNPAYTPQEQLAVGYWDPEQGAWVMLPSVSVDANQGTVTFSANHLSIYSVFALETGYRLNWRPHFRVIYNPDINAPHGGIEALAATVGGYLEDAYRAYDGFTRPEGQLEVYLDDLGVNASPSYNGTISVNAPYVDSLAELKFDMGHEYFHAVQHVRYGSLLKMWLVRWWVEASADYASGHLAAAMNPIPDVEKFMGENISARYLEQPIDYDPAIGDRHKYHTAHFLDYLVGGATFQEFWNHVSDPEAAPTSPLSRIDGYLAAHGMGTLEERYDAFAKYFLFDGTSPAPYGADGSLQDLSAYWTPFLSTRTELTGSMTLDDAYSAKLWGLPVELAQGATTRTLIVQPTTGLQSAKVYLQLIPEGSRGTPGSLLGPIAANSKTPVVFSSKSVLAVLAVGTAAGSVGIKIYDPAPRITSVPATVDAYKEFTISGEKFGAQPGQIFLGSDSVSWANECVVVSWSDSQITAIANQVGGPGYVTVWTQEGGNSKPVEVDISNLWLLQKMRHHELRIYGTFSYTDTFLGGSFQRTTFPTELPQRSYYDTIVFNGTSFTFSYTNTSGGTTITDSVSGSVDRLGTTLLSYSERWTSTTHLDDGICVLDSSSEYAVSMHDVPLFRNGSDEASTSFTARAGGSYGGDPASLVTTMSESVDSRKSGSDSTCKYSRVLTLDSANISSGAGIDGYFGPGGL